MLAKALAKELARMKRAQAVEQVWVGDGLIVRALPGTTRWMCPPLIISRGPADVVDATGRAITAERESVA